MKKEKETLANLMVAIACLVEEGAMAVPCDRNLNPLSYPVVVDNLVMGNSHRENDQLTFIMGWRSPGVTETFESGAFNVEAPEFLKINRFDLEEDRVTLHHDLVDEHRECLCLVPIDDEHRQEWQEWSVFKQANRDYFEELDIQMINMLNQLY